VKRLLAFLTLLSVAGCGSHTPEKHGSLMEMIKESTAPNRNAGLTSETSGASLVQVEHVEMFVHSRESALEKFPCQTCHKDVAALVSPPRKAHWQVELKHAPETVMQCSTCHLGKDMNRLHTLAGQPVSFDHSYQICAQCHSRQAEDWTGGAHGKRVGGWAPPRVAKTCVECHNPHTPAWGQRWPARAAQVMREVKR
jgi:hypothetical protein